MTEPIETTLPSGAVLWELVSLPPGGAHIAEGQNEKVLRWSCLKLPESADDVVVRGIHMSTIQQKLVTLRESFAREHAQVLADIPLFAPLTSPEILELCRRATVIEVPPYRDLLPSQNHGSPGAAAGGEDPLDREVELEIRHFVRESTFGVVLKGGLRMAFRHANGGDGGALPSLVPLAHLGPTETFGELGEPLPPGVEMATGSSGATLLCWPRDSILREELDKLALLEGGTSMLECCWLARSPLALCLGAPALFDLLEPMTLTEAIEKERSGELDLKRKLVLVTSGDVLRRASQDVEFRVERSGRFSSARLSSGDSASMAESEDGSESGSDTTRARARMERQASTVGVTPVMSKAKSSRWGFGNGKAASNGGKGNGNGNGTATATGRRRPPPPARRRRSRNRSSSSSRRASRRAATRWRASPTSWPTWA